MDQDIFAANKYTACYYRIIEKAKLEDRHRGDKIIYHRHHIVPISLAGSNTKDNTVLLTVREHYVCHLLLTKMTSGRARSKMVYAFFRFSPKCSGVTSSAGYERFLKTAQKSLTGANNAFYGRSHTEETRRKIKANHGMRGRNLYNVWFEKYGEAEATKRHNAMRQKQSAALSGTKNPRYGTHRTPNQIAAHSLRMSGSKHPRYGKNFTWVNKNGTSKQATSIEELDLLLESGWVLGRGRKTY